MNLPCRDQTRLHGAVARTPAHGLCISVRESVAESVAPDGQECLRIEARYEALIGGVP